MKYIILFLTVVVFFQSCKTTQTTQQTPGEDLISFGDYLKEKLEKDNQAIGSIFSYEVVSDSTTDFVYLDIQPYKINSQYFVRFQAFNLNFNPPNSSWQNGVEYWRNFGNMFGQYEATYSKSEDNDNWIVVFELKDELTSDHIQQAHDKLMIDYQYSFNLLINEEHSLEDSY